MKHLSNHLNAMTSDVKSLDLYRTKQNFREEEENVLSPSRDSYGALIFLYDFFNARLFNGKLPACLITLPRRSQWEGGYFLPETWANASHTYTTDEIALNPLHFQSYSTEFILSILVHEMVHLEQHHFGKPGRGRYHNKQWARMMRQVGLIPSDTGKPGGKDTGDSMSHFVEEGGAFHRSCQELLQVGFVIPWHTFNPLAGDDNSEGSDGDDSEDNENSLTKKKRASKTKYSCSGCGLNAWAKPNVSIFCGTCR